MLVLMTFWSLFMVVTRTINNIEAMDIPFYFP
jgi:hypothetical protein